jgi:hypothetical protein
MRDLRWLALPAVAVVLAGAAGCSKVKFSTSAEIGPREVHTASLDPTGREQTIKVEVNSPGNPVSVYAVAAKDAQAAQTWLLEKQGEAPVKILASGKKSGEDVSFDVTVPASAGLTVLIFNGSWNKTATASIKLNSL